MADVRLTVQKCTPNGITPTNTGSLSVANTYQVRNDGKTFLHVINGGGTECNVTIDTPGNVGGLAIAQQTVAVPATTGDVMIGPFPPAIYNDPSGDLNVTFDFITSVTVATVQL